MSTAKGGVHSRKPKYQNTFAFKHNKNSKKTKKIKSIFHSHLCKRCSDQIEWRKKYRKYKPIKKPKKCRKCDLIKVKLAYHVICKDCSNLHNICGKCLKPKDSDEEEANKKINKADTQKMKNLVEKQDMNLRSKKAIIRQIEKGDMRLVEKEHEIELQPIESDSSHAVSDIEIDES